jgi:hypothetical protein
VAQTFHVENSTNLVTLPSVQISIYLPRRILHHSFSLKKVRSCLPQGCQMVYFQTKNPNLGKFCSTLKWKMLVYFMTVWNILRPFDIMYGPLVQFVVIGYMFPNLVCFDPEKSGNPGLPANINSNFRYEFNNRAAAR